MMRIAILLLLTAVLPSSVCAAKTKTEPVRNWTDAKSKKVIKARIVDKDLSNSKAQLELVGGKQVWVETARLIEKDKEYVRKWIKPIKHITARVVGITQSGRKVRVTVKAGSRHLKVSAYRYSGDREPIKKKLSPGDEIEFTYFASTKYIVKAWAGGKLVDRESWDSKTGL